MRLNQLISLTVLRQTYDELLAKYKTASGKKAFLTREIKKQESWIADVTEAVNRERNRGMLHGEIFSKIHLSHYKRELDAIIDIRSNVS